MTAEIPVVHASCTPYHQASNAGVTAGWGCLSLSLCDEELEEAVFLSGCKVSLWPEKTTATTAAGCFVPFQPSQLSADLETVPASHSDCCICFMCSNNGSFKYMTA
ncbi:hypothetical protein CHARACLAT_018708 [Characodon lateralis]|uniref:Uncharacterized protein n=1 Tax=Characodon lateralis TaxID=208331 RepID=A0ABU7F7C5_9TELE|nr:hypothetical protein [Characodon lateralis]